MNTVSIEGRILDKEDGHLYLVPHLLVDGNPLADFGNYAVDLAELRKSLLGSGNYFILTCWCGEPSCMGIEEGIRVVHEGSSIRWHLQFPFPGSKFEFDRTELVAAIDSSICSIRATLGHAQEVESKQVKVVPKASKEFF